MTSAHTDRDILITPNRTLQHAGKTVYFQPTTTSTGRTSRSHEPLVATASKDASGSTISDQQPTSLSPSASVPWEEPLKHAIYLVLNNKVDDEAADVDIAVDADRNYTTRLVNPTTSYTQFSYFLCKE